jgi:hypothetical protein
VAHKEEIRNTYRILVGKPLGNHIEATEGKEKQMELSWAGFGF